MKIYLSGKISGLSEKEYINNFKNVEDWVLFEFGFIPYVNPLDINPIFGIKRWFFFMVADILQLRKCSHIAVQKNWIDSRGAMIEVYFAKWIFKQTVIFL